MSTEVPNVGEAVTVLNEHTLRRGSLITANGGDVFTRRDVGWVDSRGTLLDWRETDGVLLLRGRGRVDTHQFFLHRIYQFALFEARQNGEWSDDLRRSLRNLQGMPSPTALPGTLFHIYVEAPAEKFLVAPRNGMDAGGLLEMGSDGSRVRLAPGDRSMDAHYGTIMPSQDELMWRGEAVSLDDDFILTMKRKVLSYGLTLKSNKGWCGVFERTLGTLAITDANR